jgi:hypothetical protein
MTKQEIRSLIKNLLPKIDADNKYHPKVIDAAIEKVLAEMYNDIWALDPNLLAKFAQRYGGTTTITVSKDLNANIYYSTYPARFIPFPDKASGIRRVTTRTQSGMNFYPMDSREVEYVASGSYVNTISNKIGYIVTQERLEYFDMTASVAATGVRMDIIIPFSVYAETDNVLVPEIVDAQGQTFTDRVLRILGVIQPPDTGDDNKTTIQQQAK